MHHFSYRNGILHAEGISLERIAREVGTPTYVYSTATLLRHYRVVDGAFGTRPHLVCYSVKANSNLAILSLLAREGSGFDIVSGGELFRALKAGALPSRVVFSGVGKTEEELALALDSRILALNVESEQELDCIARLAKARGRSAPVALRVNPGVDAKTHAHITTARKESKFGISMDRAAALYRRHRANRALRFVGVDCHIGSQMTQLLPLRRAVARAADLYRALLAEGFQLGYLDVGGGLGITYEEENPPSPAEWASAIAQAAQGLTATLIVEPGRVLVGNAGILVSRLIWTKSAGKKDFLVVDAGMNDLVRPALYGARHQILPVRRSRGRAVRVDVVGPICESTDVLGRDCALPAMRSGDLIAVMGAGAYGMSMASTYNSRPRPAEVLVDGRTYRLARARETWKDLVRGESPLAAGSVRRLRSSPRRR
jgi:diaminopimelate decarboxylase